MTTTALLQEAASYQEQLVRTRRFLHTHPGTGFDIQETVDYVKQELISMGYEPQMCGKSGIVALAGGKKDGKVFLIRGDMDALPMKEEADVSFPSTNGKMHACGHDMHTTMMLGAARLLKSHEDEIEGTVKLMFQPADLRFIQRRQVRFLFGQVHAAVLQCRIQLVQLRHIIILFVHGTADLLRCQGMVACPRGQCSGQFLRLRQFLHGSCSFPLLLQPEGKAGDHSSTGTFPCFFSRIDWR